MLCGLVKLYYYYCFTHEVSLIKACKPLVAIFKKGIAPLSQRIERILLCIHQCKKRILYKPGALTIYSRLAVKTQSQCRYRWQNTGDESEYQCYRNKYRHPRMHDSSKIRCIMQEDDHLSALLTEMVYIWLSKA